MVITQMIAAIMPVNTILVTSGLLFFPPAVLLIIHSSRLLTLAGKEYMLDLAI